MLTTKHALTSFVAVALLALILSACGSESDTPADATDAPVSSANTSSTSGSGTLTLGSDTYEFNVDACDISGDYDDDYQTISGRGQLADGETFYVFVSRNQVQDMLTHLVSFQYGDIRSGEGTVIETQRMYMNGTWINIYGDPREPLIHIEGNTVRASGTFAHTEDVGNTMQGSLQATCNR